MKAIKTSLAMSDWFKNFGVDTSAYRREEVSKVDRLKKLSELIHLPTYRVYTFSPSEIISESNSYKKFYKANKNKYFTLNLLPLSEGISKQRVKGVKISEATKWLKRLKTDYAKYSCNFIDFSFDTLWSLNFIVNKHGIFGEYCEGVLLQITWGKFDKKPTVKFTFDYHKLFLSKDTPETKKRISRVLKYLYIKKIAVRKKLRTSLKSSFTENYLNGYFEVIFTKEYGLWFLDYNREIWKLYKDFSGPSLAKSAEKPFLTGRVAHPGDLEGKAHLVLNDNYLSESLTEEEILVCVNTTSDYIRLIKSAKAVITDQGGILSHASIVCREIGKPCIVATFEATKKLKNGDLIRINGQTGEIFKLN